MKTIYIGIDGGGSKTKLKMVDKDGLLLAQALTGPANIRLSVDVAYDSIYQAFELCLKELKIPIQTLNQYTLHAGLGLAGYEVKSARESFLNKKLPFTSVVLQSDAYTACMGAHGGKNGSIVIAGTGVVGLKITHGVKKQIGGWGFPHGDEGGGAWLGLESVKALLQMCDKLRPPSDFLNEIKVFLGSSRSRITQWACSASATQYAELTPLIVNYAQKNDPLAISLLKQAAHHIETLLELFLDGNHENLPCSFVGGMASVLSQYIKTSLQKKISQPLFDPCDGAIFMVKNYLNSF